MADFTTEDINQLGEALAKAIGQTKDRGLIKKRVEEFAPDVIGIGSFTVTFETTVKVGTHIKNALPTTPIILGSYHVTLMPDEAMSHQCFDVGVLGEGEFTMKELVEHYQYA